MLVKAQKLENKINDYSVAFKHVLTCNVKAFTLKRKWLCILKCLELHELPALQTFPGHVAAVSQI